MPERLTAGHPPRTARRLAAEQRSSEAVRRARETFLACRRIDMNSLAAELGVNRVTLFRNVGNRQQLLVNVLWSMARKSLELNKHRAQRRSDDWLADTLAGFVRDWSTSPACQHFMREEGELAVRLTTHPEHGFQPRMLAVVEQMLGEQLDQGQLTTGVPIDELAFVTVRIVESYAHINYFSGRTESDGNLDRVLRVVLHPNAGGQPSAPAPTRGLV
jgi:hypothetical protein